MKIFTNIFIFLLLILTKGVLAQCSLYEVPLVNRVNKASLIIEGKVLESRSIKSEKNGKIYTINKVEVFKIFKGSVSSATIEIVTEGGAVEGEMLLTSNLLSLNKGEIGIFILKPAKFYIANQSLLFEAVASLQGFIKYDPVSLSASDVFNEYKNIQQQLYPSLSNQGKYIAIKTFDISELANDSPSSRMIPLITGFFPIEISAGTEELLVINGSGFGNTRGSGSVGFRNADDGGASFIEPLPSQYVKWEDTEIIVEVPDNAGTGQIRVAQGVSVISQATLTILFSHINLEEKGSAYSAAMIAKSPSGGYVWQMSELFKLNKRASTSFIRAINTWKCNTGVNWLIGEVTLLNKAARDEINIICFDSFEELPEGALGVAYSYYSSCQEGQWYLSEIDIVFDAGVNWQFGPPLPGATQVDMETIALHELGHAHQLAHVIDPSDIMHYSYSQGTQNRELDVSNVLAANLVMERSINSGVCGFNPMEKIPSIICDISELEELTFDGLNITPTLIRSSFKIMYTLAEKSSVNIVIFDNLGQLIHVVANETQPIGIYQYTLNLDDLNLAIGMYYIRLYLNDSKYTYKIIRI